MRKKYFEFKSYGSVPPTDFNTQFINDLNNLNIVDIKQLQWLFDAAKNPSDFSANILKAIDDLPNSDILPETLKKFNVTSTNQLKAFLKNNFDGIFKLN